jgi:hypothetical protein
VKARSLAATNVATVVSWNLLGSPVTPRAGRLVGAERTRRAGLRCADVVIRGVDQRGAPKRRALKHNAERFMRSRPAADCSCALRAHRIIRATFKCPPASPASQSPRLSLRGLFYFPRPPACIAARCMLPSAPRWGLPQEAR